MIVSDLAIQNRTTVWVIIVLLGVFGTYSYLTIPRESEPDVPIPYVIVTTVYEGVSPEDVETAVTMKLEKKLQGLKGVKELRSSSAEGISLIQIEFLPEINIDDALQRVRDKVDQARPDLPDDVEAPTLTEINISDFPIMVINLSGPISPVILKEIAKQLEDRIETISGVLDVQVLGALEREIRLEFDPDRLAAYRISIPELVSLIPSENVNISGGNVEGTTAKFTVRVPGEFVKPEDVDHLLLTVRDGKPIYLADVVKVRDTFKDREGRSRLNGQECVTLSIQKRIGANIITVSDSVKMVLEKARPYLPEGVTWNITLDQSKDIRVMLEDLENNVLTGLVLVIGILFLFMDWRSSLIVATEVPLSMLMSFSILQLMGVTLNIVVLFSLILAQGMLVDNAIVVVENIFRHRQEGKDATRGAIDGVGEVAWPVITSTLTTQVAFAPMLFWPGIIGEFMKFLPLTLIVTLGTSLFVALVINCTMAATLLKVQPQPGYGAWGERFMRRYQQFLSLAMNHAVTTLVLSIMILVALGIAYLRFGHGVEFFPEVDPQRAYISLKGSQGTSLEESDRWARMVEKVVEKYRHDLRYYVTNVGSGSGGQGLSDAGGSGTHTARISLDFYDFLDRPRPSNDVVRDVRAALPELPGVEVKVKKQEHGPPRGAPVEIEIAGEDFKVLTDLADQVQREIINVPGLVNLREGYEQAKPELQFIVDRRRAMMLGLNTNIVGNFLKTSFWGRKVSTYRQYDDEYDITVRLPLKYRHNIDDLYRLQVPNPNGKPIPLSSIGRFVYTGGKGTIERVNQQRVITVLGDNEGRLATEVLADVQKRLEKMTLPAGYLIRYAGENKDQKESEDFLWKCFGAALFGIVLILVAQFNSLRVPVIIMTTVILSLIGVMLGLLVARIPFGIIMTGIGVIGLAGVVVNNAIVLLDYTRQLQARGMNIIEASVQAGVTRLRPVFLTAATTVLGVIPMVIGVNFNFRYLRLEIGGESVQWWRPMAIAVAFGLTLATVLTLVVVPTLYCLLHGGGRKADVPAAPKVEPVDD